MNIDIKHLDFLFTERFNVKKMIEDLEKWISEKKLNQNDFYFEVDIDHNSPFNMRASLRFEIKKESFYISYLRKLNFIQTMQDIDKVEIELFKINVIDLIEMYGDFSIIKIEDASIKHVEFIKYNIRDGENIITVDEKFLLENYNMIDNIFSTSSNSESHDDAKNRLKKLISKNFT